LIGWVSGLSPFVCCKRALIGAMLAYVAGYWAIKAINAILVNAMIASQMNQQEGGNLAADHKLGYREKGSGGTD
jgi:hypothetical protein